jgi:UDP-3-O-[3-hydroxymyristoyl] glucosamine N-acyltransferase
MKSAHKTYVLSELVNGLDLTLQGDPNTTISGVATIQRAAPGQITFLTNPLYRKYLETTQASAVILTEADAEFCRTNKIVSRNPYYTYAQIAAYFDARPKQESGIHPTAMIGEDSVIDATASVGAHVVIGRGVQIGPRVKIGPNCVIGDDTQIGEDSQLDSNVTIYFGVVVGKRVRIASGVVIGADGFGFANQQRVWYKVAQLGSVVIGDDVDIGANTTIDRGAIENTVIEKGVKLDNLIQIGHNVQIGENTIIAGCTGIAGSTTIGKNCMIGGASCFAGHIDVTDNVMLSGLSTVTKSITAPGHYSSGIVGAIPNHEFLKNNARFNRLENLMDRVKTLESALKQLTERDAS